MALTQDQKNGRLSENGPLLLETLSPFFMNENILLQLLQGDPPILLPSQKSHLAARCSKFLEELCAGSLMMYTDFISLLRRNNRGDIADVLAGTQSATAACQQANSPDAGTQSLTAACQQAGTPTDSRLDEKQVRKFLERHGSAAMEALGRYIGPVLLRDLVAGNALTKQEENLIKNEEKHDEQVDKLLEFISDREKFHNFRKVLKERREDYIEKMIQRFLLG